MTVQFIAIRLNCCAYKTINIHEDETAWYISPENKTKVNVDLLMNPSTP